jgi:serine/threonine protein kinase
MCPVNKNIKDTYEILEQIGRGGMAQIYKARQLSLDRIVAIKEIKPAFAKSHELVERFKREARTAASLVHENIVQVYNFGEPKPDSLFIVMEYVDGMDLKSLLLSAGTVPPRIAAVVIREVARALSYAHSRGLVHRDVKPGNIMITRRGEVKLMDFGIVREMDSDLTRTGAFLGTPNYMAPEQFLGDEITPATDIFSVGVVLYEILGGQKPFKADSEGSLARKVRIEKESRLRSLNPSVPRRLQRITSACLRKKPGRRPADADALIHQLDRYIGSRRREELRKELALWVSEAASADHTLDLGRKSEDEAQAEKEKPSAPPRAASKSGKGRKPSGLKEELKKQKDKKKKTASSARGGKKDKAALAFEGPPADESREDLGFGNVIVTWLWRIILLAIALLAAVIMFQLLDPLSDADGKKEGSGIRGLIEKLK